jgi:hypothetical protein
MSCVYCICPKDELLLLTWDFCVRAGRAELAMRVTHIHRSSRHFGSAERARRPPLSMPITASEGALTFRRPVRDPAGSASPRGRPNPPWTGPPSHSPPQASEALDPPVVVVAIPPARMASPGTV